MGTEFMDPKALERYDLHRAHNLMDAYDMQITLGNMDEDALAHNLVERIAKLLAEERERCAKIADEYQADYLAENGTEEDAWAVGAEMVAKHIRGVE